MTTEKPEKQYRPSAETWAEIQTEWENEPKATYTSLAEKYKINRASICKKCKKDNWVKRKQLGQINAAADRRADAITDSDGNKATIAKGRKATSADIATRQQSEILRASVKVRHRGELAQMEQFRQAALKTMKEAHEEGKTARWSMAKVAADTFLSNIRGLLTKQDAETKAWGLHVTEEEDKDAPQNIVFYIPENGR